MGCVPQSASSELLRLENANLKLQLQLAQANQKSSGGSGVGSFISGIANTAKDALLPPPK